MSVLSPSLCSFLPRLERPVFKPFSPLEFLSLLKSVLPPASLLDHPMLPTALPHFVPSFLALGSHSFSCREIATLCPLL